MGNRENLRDSCEEFMSRQQAGIRAILRGDYASSDARAAWEAPNFCETLWRAMDAYEEILKNCPKHLREYRRQRIELAIWCVTVTLPTIKVGRPIDRKIQDRGRNAARLRIEGKTWGQVAKTLCPQRGDEGHRCDKRCVDRLRQSAQRYLRSN